MPLAQRLDPERLRPLGERVLVRKYTRPEKSAGGIYFSDAWRQDNSRSLWETVKASEGAEDKLGYRLPPDTIVITAPNRGVFVGEDASGAELYMLWAADIHEIVSWTEEDEDGSASGD